MNRIRPIIKAYSWVARALARRGLTPNLEKPWKEYKDNRYSEDAEFYVWILWASEEGKPDSLVAVYSRDHNVRRIPNNNPDLWDSRDMEAIRANRKKCINDPAIWESLKTSHSKDTWQTIQQYKELSKLTANVSRVKIAKTMHYMMIAYSHGHIPTNKQIAQKFKLNLELLTKTLEEYGIIARKMNIGGVEGNYYLKDECKDKIEQALKKEIVEPEEETGPAQLEEIKPAEDQELLDVADDIVYEE